MRKRCFGVEDRSRHLSEEIARRERATLLIEKMESSGKPVVSFSEKLLDSIS